MGINVREISERYDFEIEGVSYIGNPKDHTVMYITKKIEGQLINLSCSMNCLVFAERLIDVPEALKTANCIVLTETPQLDYALFVTRLCEKNMIEYRNRDFHLTEGGYYLGENVRLGENTYIEPYCFIDHDVIIGSGAKILSGAKIRNAQIGNNVLINENAHIGTYGFTMTRDKNQNLIRIPTLGKVVIGNDVEVGTMTNIAAGSAGDTIIGDHAKLDAFVHIGHDAYIGENVEIPAGAVIGGYDRVERNAFIGINATLRNRINVGENAIIGMGAVVTKSVAADAIVIGNPARPLNRDAAK